MSNKSIIVGEFFFIYKYKMFKVNTKNNVNNKNLRRVVN
jgi:hypothetical protein